MDMKRIGSRNGHEAGIGDELRAAPFCGAVNPRRRQMKAREIMTESPDAVIPSDLIQRAAEIMRDRDIGFVPIVDDRKSMKLAGVITDRDITVRHVAAGHPRECKVNEHMTGVGIETVGPDAEVGEVLDVMQRAQVRRVPVVESDGRLVGVIAQADIAVDADLKAEDVARTVEKISEPAEPRR
jgi:CBS domain-containing protein